jgi:GAF domain-containing protein
VTAEDTTTGEGGLLVPIDLTALTTSISRLDQVTSADDEPAELLHRVLESAQSLFGLSGLGLMFVDENEALRYVAATNSAVHALERAQEESGEGPCVDSLVLDEVVACEDLSTDDRYRVVGRVVAEHGIRAVLGVPVRLGGAAVGTLNVHRDRPHLWDDSDITAIRGFAGVIEAVLRTLLAAERHSRLSDQLTYALEHRVVIERSIGYLMARDGVDAVTAFDVLRRSSRSSRRKVGEVAADVLAGKELPV